MGGAEIFALLRKQYSSKRERMCKNERTWKPNGF